MNLTENIRTTIERHGLISPGANLVVGVSGGADSVALVHALHQLNYAFTIAHLNHQLRGTDSDLDEAFVRNLGFPTVTHSVDVKAAAKKKNISIEMAARDARHDLFKQFDNATIVLAHHADDQAETFLLKLARGAGPEGLGGIRPCQKMGKLRIIRPMLELSRVQIQSWLKQNDHSWREDLSNTDESFLRNKIRHTILPNLTEQLNPALSETLQRTMTILREENDWIESLLKKASLSDNLPRPAKRRILRNWLFKNGANEANFLHVESILDQMEKPHGTKTIELNATQRVLIEYGTPRFVTQSPNSSPHFKITSTPRQGWKSSPTAAIGKLPATASFSAAQLGSSSVSVRPWRAGDRMAPLGMQGSRKIQDILTDHKIPQEHRKNIPIVLCREEIIWLPGYRIARGWEVEHPQAEAIDIRIEQIDKKALQDYAP